jgi:hypothetical protein
VAVEGITDMATIGDLTQFYERHALVTPENGRERRRSHCWSS